MHQIHKETDPIILAEGCAITGGIGETLPNYNVLVVGCSGTGKSLSVNYPTLYGMKEDSVIATFAKEGEACRMAQHFRQKGYKTHICNLANPEKSDIGFDPMMYVRTSQDRDALAAQIVYSTIRKMEDDYWQKKAMPLLGALIDAARMTSFRAKFPDVLNLFDRMLPKEDSAYSFLTGADDFFEELRERYPNCYAVREFFSFRSLPYRTGSCVRDTLAACLNDMFPSSVRDLMRKPEKISFRDLATERTALFIVTPPAGSVTAGFSNLIYNTAIRKLMEFAQEQEDDQLPRSVRLVFDDFAVGSKLQGFAEYVSIFRSAGISALVLLQSETQLMSLYGERDGQTILNNMSTYCYFSGGMDLLTCQNVARRMNKPLDSILYSPLDRVYVMQAGRKPLITKRYPILQDERYQQMRRLSKFRDCERR